MNLYPPSVFRWTAENGAQCSLSQREYPIENTIAMHLRLSRPCGFELRLRIPSRSQGAPPFIRVNGERVSALVQTGFATVGRLFKDGDRNQLELYAHSP